MERVVTGRQFYSGENRGCGAGKTRRGKGTKWRVVVDGAGVPLGNDLHFAFPSEAKLVEATLEAVPAGRCLKPHHLIAERGYDSDPLRRQLAARSIELMAPHRKNRHKLPTQDSRALRRYKRRWVVERAFAWLGTANDRWCAMIAC